MSSLLIQGMEMPNKKNGAVLIIYSGGECVFEDGKEYKAVTVQPHYDLIDHNALKIAVMDCDAETRVDFLKHAMDCINHAPVVIQSDISTYEAKVGEDE